PSPQTEALMSGRKVRFLPDIASRDWRGAIQAVSKFRELIADNHFDAVVSTGAAIAVPAFIAARQAGLPTLFVESVSRVRGPSLTGKIVATTGLATQAWTQHPHWAS